MKKKINWIRKKKIWLSGKYSNSFTQDSPLPFLIKLGLLFRFCFSKFVNLTNSLTNITKYVLIFYAYSYCVPWLLFRLRIHSYKSGTWTFDWEILKLNCIYIRKQIKICELKGTKHMIQSTNMIIDQHFFYINWIHSIINK